MLSDPSTPEAIRAPALDRRLGLVGNLSRTAAALVLVASQTAVGEDSKFCESPTTEDTHIVEVLLNEPEPYNVERMQRGMEEQQASGFRGDYTEQAIVDINAHAAERLGLTTFGYLGYVRPLRADEYDPETNNTIMPFSEYFTRASEFANLFGLEVTTDPPDGYSYSDGRRAPTEEELETLTAKSNMQDLIENLGLLPKELFEFVGLERIVLYYGEDSVDENFEVAAYVTPDAPGTYFVNMRHSLDRKIFSHELYHLLDFKLCGVTGARVDPVFRAINGGPVYSAEEGIDPSAVVTVDDISRFYDEYADPDMDAEARRIFDEARARMEENSISVSDYGATSVIEDKAETFSEMMDNPLQEGGDFIDRSYPYIEEKEIFLLARLFMHRPDLAQYLIATNAPTNL